jgi:hypothetical protein
MASSLKFKISTLFGLFSEPKVLKFIISQRYAGFLYYKSGSSVDKNNNPIPWMTYSFIDFIEERLNKELEIFEFGSGNSTIFFAKRVKNVMAAEHNAKWHDKVKDKVPNNAEVKLVALTDYENSIDIIKQYDIIIVDGERRNECIVNSIKALTKQGVIILDDSEREDYKSGIKYLLDQGYKVINFWGVAPGTFFNKCTSIFYKQGNCLGI